MRCSWVFFLCTFLVSTRLHGQDHRRTSSGDRITEKENDRPVEGLVRDHTCRTGTKMGVAWNYSYSYTAHHFFWEKQFENLLCELGSMKTPTQFQSGRILLDWSCIPSFHGSLHLQTTFLRAVNEQFLMLWVVILSASKSILYPRIFCVRRAPQAYGITCPFLISKSTLSFLALNFAVSLCLGLTTKNDWVCGRSACREDSFNIERQRN